MTDCQFRGCEKPSAVRAFMLCEHDVQHFCFEHSQLMKSMVTDDTFMQCGAYIDEEHPNGCGVQGLAEDVYRFEWEKA